MGGCKETYIGATSALIAEAAALRIIKMYGASGVCNMHRVFLHIIQYIPKCCTDQRGFKDSV